MWELKEMINGNYDDGYYNRIRNDKDYNGNDRKHYLPMNLFWFVCDHTFNSWLVC